MSKKKLRREQARIRHLRHIKPEEVTEIEKKQVNKPETRKSEGFFTNIYENHYKKLLIIPFIILILAISQIGVQLAMTGDFVSKGVSLKGGITVTIPDIDHDAKSFESFLKENFNYDIAVRSISKAGTSAGLIVDADITSQSEIRRFTDTIQEKLEIENENYSVEVIGSSLGDSFFKEIFKAIIIAFIFMGTVVFIYFSENNWMKILSFILAITVAFIVFTSKTMVMNIIALVLGLILLFIFFKYSIPSIAVILAAVSDMIITLAVINILGIKLSTAGIAAFLMLIGYSVDTDILLTTKVLKRKEGTILDGVYAAMKTGVTMNATTIFAVIAGLIVSQSEILKQIMTIILIGLIADLFNTWLQNAGILRWYLEKEKHKPKTEGTE